MVRKIFGLLLAGMLPCATPITLYAQDAAPSPLYVLETATVLPSTDTDWDYSKLEPEGARLFMARRKDGLVVYDVDQKKQIAVIENSIGANGPLLLPQFNRAYVAMTDGTLLSLDLKTLKVLARDKLAEDGGLNGTVFDPSTGHVLVLTAQRPKESTWFVLDAKTGKLLSKKTFPFTKMDDPAVDGKGNVFAPARYDNIIMKLDAKTLAEKARWTVGDCVQPTTVEYQASTKRLLVGCRGDKPVLLAIDPETGKITASAPIGKGLDGMAIDEHRHRILTSNGVDANLSVIAQDGPDSLRVLGNVMTRPNAKIMQMDEKTGRVFIVTAEHTVLPPAKDGGAPVITYHPNSFVVMTYKP